MKLTKKHINQLFDVEGGDGSWVYQLIDIKNGELLFYTFEAGGYEIVPAKKYSDWRRFRSRPHKDRGIKRGWELGRREK